MVLECKVLNDFSRFIDILIAEFVASGAVNLALKMKGDMIIKNLNLKPTIDAMMRGFLEQELHRIPGLEDIYEVLSDGIFTSASYDDEGAMADFTNLESTVNGHRQEERIDYDEVFAHVARIKAIGIFLAFASYMGFIVYQMDVKSAFLYAPKAWYATLSALLEKSGYRRGTIYKTLFIKRGKKDIILVQIYVDDIIFGSTKKSWCDEFEALMKSWFQMSSMGELTFFLGLQVKQKEDVIFIIQDKYVAEILKKFDFMSVKTASTLIETQKPLVKDEEVADVDVHIYRSMIGSLMYLTASRPDIMFAVCACSRFQVTPKTSHLHAVKRIFWYLRGKPKLGLWYARVSAFDLEAYSDSDYASINLDRKSTTGGCQFLGRRLNSWQCKKQTIMATFTTEAEYVDVANCCGQVLWIQNQMLDYGFNFLNPKIYIDNESTICIVKNLVFHSKTKHIEIRHHFIRDAYEKKLIKVLKIHTNDNVADLLTKAFDVSSGLPYMKLDLLLSHFNDVSYIKAKVAGKTVSISEASIRRDLLFNDVDGIDCHVTPLFPNMLAQVVVDEGEGSEQPTPSPTQPSTGDQTPVTESSYSPDTTQDPRVNLEGTSGSQGDHVQIPHDSPLLGGHTSNRAEGGLNLEELSVFCTNLSNRVLALETSKGAQAAEILKLKTRIKKLKRKCQPVISHHKAWLRSVFRLSMKKKLGKKESVSKQGKKNAKSGPKLDDSAFDDLDADLAHGMDDMETKEAVNEGRKSNETEELNLDADTEVIAEDKGSEEKGGSTVSTARLEVNTARPDVGTARQEISTVDPTTPPTTTTIFDDEEMTLADTLVKMKDNKAKGVVFKDTEELVARDAEVARQLEVELQGEVERERKREEQASMDYIANLYDEVQARIDADHELAARLTHEEQEKYTMDERAKLLAEFFERRKKQLAEERAVAIRNKPPTRTQLRSLMITYLKHT
ncbi:putative ribonuclease H-like domain-containing protein, partial [Tanacetum coccineum]